MYPLAFGLYGDEDESLIPNGVTTSENSEFLNSLPLSDRLPLNLHCFF